MFFISHAVVSVFALAVLLNVFNFDPAQSYKTYEIFDTCDLCMKSECHTEKKQPCVPDPSNFSLCYKCENNNDYNDTMYNTENDCKSSCSDPSKCKCDDDCWVCVLKDYTNATQCANSQQAYDDNCNLVPYTPQ